MLQALRNQVSSWVVKILLGFLILSFAVWGVNDIFLGERDPVVAEVGDIKITRSQVEDEIREELNRLQPLFGGRLDRTQAERMGITDQVLNNMIARAAMAQGARDLGITVSDEQVARRIRGDETFFSARGQFDRNVFAQVLSRAGMNEDFYVASLKRDLAAAEISAAIQGAAQAPATIVDPLVEYRAERRVAKSVQVPAPSADGIADPSPAEVDSFYRENPDLFMAPPTRDVTYIHLDPAAMAKEIQISEERLKQGYEERLDQYTTRNQRQLEQVVFQDQQAAQTVSQALQDGTSLAEAAKTADKAPVQLGWIEKTDILPELADPVFSLQKGQTSQPIKTPLGWHIVRVTDVREGNVKPFSEVRDELRQTIAEREAMDAIYGMINQVEDALAAGGSMEDAARQLNMKAVRLPAITQRGHNADGEPIEGLPGRSEFLQTAFETSVGQDSQLAETQGGGFFVLHVNGETPAKPRLLEDIRADVVTAWKAEQRAKKAEERATAILERLKNGEKLEAVAGAENLEVKTSPPFTRLTHDAESGLPPALMDQLFKARVGEAAKAASEGSQMVAVLSEVREPSQKEKAETAESLREELTEGIAGDLFQQLVGSMRERYEIEVNRNVIRGGS